MGYKAFIFFCQQNRTSQSHAICNSNSFVLWVKRKNNDTVISGNTKCKAVWLHIRKDWVRNSSSTRLLHNARTIIDECGRRTYRL
jgi:hypothetical protein